MFKTRVIEDIDVLVVGGGMAACFAAIKAKQGAKKVVQVDKGHAGKSGCSVTGAGILHVLLPEEGDKILADRVKRLARAQGYLVHMDMIQDHLEQSWGIVEDMEKWGVEFERASSGGIESQPGRGAHPVIQFHGPQLMDVMMKTGKKVGVTQVNRVMVTDLLTNSGKVVGAVGFDIRSGEFVVFKAKATVLAMGSTWYRGLLPGHRDTTGDAYAAAFRAGAVLRGAENNDMVSHAMPARFDIGPGLTMYQGLGGRWYNVKGERIMEKYNPALKEQAGLRNIMYAFSLEVRRGNGPIHIDMTHFTEAQVQRMRRVIPLPMRMFERAGLVVGDKFVQRIEWMLCPPIGRPGVMVNRAFEASMPGLYACGEAAASSAVVTGLAAAGTSGASAGANAAKFAAETESLNVLQAQVDALKEKVFAPLERKGGFLPEQIALAVQENIIPYEILLIREEDRMQKALENIEYARDNYLTEIKAYDLHNLKNAHEAANMLFTAELHLATSLYRKESRVGLREDYPYTDNENWFKWIEVANDSRGYIISTRPVPVDQFPFKIRPGRELHYVWKLAEDMNAVKVERGEIKWV